MNPLVLQSTLAFIHLILQHVSSAYHFVGSLLGTRWTSALPITEHAGGQRGGAAGNVGGGGTSL
jgi:hypothetical protein